MLRLIGHGPRYLYVRFVHMMKRSHLLLKTISYVVICLSAFSCRQSANIRSVRDSSVRETPLARYDHDDEGYSQNVKIFGNETNPCNVKKVTFNKESVYACTDGSLIGLSADSFDIAVATQMSVNPSTAILKYYIYENGTCKSFGQSIGRIKASLIHFNCPINRNIYVNAKVEISCFVSINKSVANDKMEFGYSCKMDISQVHPL